jgi:hypothetical protein
MSLDRKTDFSIGLNRQNSMPGRATYEQTAKRLDASWHQVLQNPLSKLIIQAVYLQLVFFSGL